jgi:hypothetical protein
MPRRYSEEDLNLHTVSDVRRSTHLDIGAGDIPNDIISSPELVELSGASYRQIDYWCSQGILPVIDGKNTPGSGGRRHFHKGIVDKVKLLVKISKAFSRDNSPLQYIMDHYDEGEFDLGDGVYLTWDVIEIEREV